LIIGNCEFADDVLYDLESNTWVKFRQDGRATVGINTILAWLGGAVAVVTFKKVGTVVEKGKSLGAFESRLHFDTVRSPISGTVVRTNYLLERSPKLLNSDPYSRGWFAELLPRGGDDRGSLRSSVEARAALEAKIAELRVRCFAEFPDEEMFEIGTECSAVLVRLNELLSTSAYGTVVHLVSDDPTSEVEMARWKDSTGNQVLEVRREENLIHYIVKKTST